MQNLLISILQILSNIEPFIILENLSTKSLIFNREHSKGIIFKGILTIFQGLDILQLKRPTIS